eukprot:gene4704-6604_t
MPKAQISLPFNQARSLNEDQQCKLIHYQAKRLSIKVWEVDSLIELCKTKGLLDKGLAVLYEYAGYIDEIQHIMETRVNLYEKLVKNIPIMELNALEEYSEHEGSNILRDLNAYADLTSLMLKALCNWRSLQWTPRPILFEEIGLSNIPLQEILRQESIRFTNIISHLPLACFRSISSTNLMLLVGPTISIESFTEMFLERNFNTLSNDYVNDKILINCENAKDLHKNINSVLQVETKVESCWNNLHAVLSLIPMDGDVRDNNLTDLYPTLRLPYADINAPTTDLNWFGDSVVAYKLLLQSLIKLSNDDGVIEDYHNNNSEIVINTTDEPSAPETVISPTNMNNKVNEVTLPVPNNNAAHSDNNNQPTFILKSTSPVVFSKSSDDPHGSSSGGLKSRKKNVKTKSKNKLVPAGDLSGDSFDQTGQSISRSNSAKSLHRVTSSDSSYELDQIVGGLNRFLSKNDLNITIADSTGDKPTPVMAKAEAHPSDPIITADIAESDPDINMNKTYPIVTADVNPNISIDAHEDVAHLETIQPQDVPVSTTGVTPNQSIEVQNDYPPSGLLEEDSNYLSNPNSTSNSSSHIVSSASNNLARLTGNILGEYLSTRPVSAQQKGTPLNKSTPSTPSTNKKKKNKNKKNKNNNPKPEIVRSETNDEEMITSAASWDSSPMEDYSDNNGATSNRIYVDFGSSDTLGTIGTTVTPSAINKIKNDYNDVVPNAITSQSNDGLQIKSDFIPSSNPSNLVVQKSASIDGPLMHQPFTQKSVINQADIDSTPSNQLDKGKLVAAETNHNRTVSIPSDDNQVTKNELYDTSSKTESLIAEKKNKQSLNTQSVSKPMSVSITNTLSRTSKETQTKNDKLLINSFLNTPSPDKQPIIMSDNTSTNSVLSPRSLQFREKVMNAKDLVVKGSKSNDEEYVDIYEDDEEDDNIGIFQSKPSSFLRAGSQDRKLLKSSMADAQRESNNESPLYLSTSRIFSAPSGRLSSTANNHSNKITANPSLSLTSPPKTSIVSNSNNSHRQRQTQPKYHSKLLSTLDTFVNLSRPSSDISQLHGEMRAESQVVYMALRNIQINGETIVELAAKKISTWWVLIGPRMKLKRRIFAKKLSLSIIDSMVVNAVNIGNNNIRRRRTLLRQGAALKIQRVFRIYNTTLLVNKRHEKMLKRSEKAWAAWTAVARAVLSGLRIFRIIRRHYKRKNKKIRNRLMLQNIYHILLNYFQQLTLSKKLTLNLNNIQSDAFFSMYHLDIGKCNQATVVIQKHFRGYLAKCSIARMRFFRKMLARIIIFLTTGIIRRRNKIRKKRNEAASRIQRFIRGVLIRIEVMKVVRAGMRLNMIWKKHMAYKKLKQQLRRVEKPYTVIVRGLRGLPRKILNGDQISFRLSVWWNPLLHIVSTKDFNAIINSKKPQYIYNSSSFTLVDEVNLMDFSHQGMNSRLQLRNLTRFYSNPKRSSTAAALDPVHVLPVTQQPVHRDTQNYNPTVNNNNNSNNNNNANTSKASAGMTRDATNKIMVAVREAEGDDESESALSELHSDDGLLDQPSSILSEGIKLNYSSAKKDSYDDHPLGIDSFTRSKVESEDSNSVVSHNTSSSINYLTRVKNSNNNTRITQEKPVNAANRPLTNQLSPLVSLHDKKKSFSLGVGIRNTFSFIGNTMTMQKRSSGVNSIPRMVCNFEDATVKIPGCHGNSVLKFEIMENDRKLGHSFFYMSKDGEMMYWGGEYQRDVIINGQKRQQSQLAKVKNNGTNGDVIEDTAPILEFGIVSGAPMRSRCQWGRIFVKGRGPLKRSIQRKDIVGSLFFDMWYRYFLSLDGFGLFLFDNKFSTTPYAHVPVKDFKYTTVEPVNPLRSFHSNEVNAKVLLEDLNNLILYTHSGDEIFMRFQDAKSRIAWQESLNNAIAAHRKSMMSSEKTRNGTNIQDFTNKIFHIKRSPMSHSGNSSGAPNNILPMRKVSEVGVVIDGDGGNVVSRPFTPSSDRLDHFKLANIPSISSVISSDHSEFNIHGDSVLINSNKNNNNKSSGNIYYDISNANDTMNVMHSSGYGHGVSPSLSPKSNRGVSPPPSFHNTSTNSNNNVNINNGNGSVTASTANNSQQYRPSNPNPVLVTHRARFAPQN